MVKYHPDVRFLTDYSAGTLPRSQALCVAAHLHFCSGCKSRVLELMELGAEFFEQQDTIKTSSNSFETLVNRIKDDSNSSIPITKANHLKVDEKRPTKLPRAIHKLCDGDLTSLDWKSIGKNFRFSNLKVRDHDRKRETSLFYIKAGGNVPQHKHQGDEITVVLEGSFSDNEDRYHVGDFVVRTKGETHKPVASQNEDCLCLSTLDSPITISNPLVRILLPFFGSSA